MSYVYIIVYIYIYAIGYAAIMEHSDDQDGS